jgi:hypothetical protein
MLRGNVVHQWTLPEGFWTPLYPPLQAAELAEYTAKIALLEEARRRKEDEVEEWQHRVSEPQKPGMAVGYVLGGCRPHHKFQEPLNNPLQMASLFMRQKSPKEWP